MKKKEEKKLTKDQAEKKILLLKKDLFNIRFKKVNNEDEFKSLLVKNDVSYKTIIQKMTTRNKK